MPLRSFAAWVFIVGALSFSAWYAVRALAPSRAIDAFATRVAMEHLRWLEVRKERIARLTYIEADDPEAVRGAFRDAISDPHSVLTDASREALLRAVGDQIAARAAPTPADYLALADREKTRWIGPNDSDDLWRLPSFYHERLTGKVPRRTEAEAREALKLALETLWKEYGVRMRRIGVGEWGTSVYVGRTREQAVALIASFPTRELDMYWDATSTVGPVRYRVPQRSYMDVLREHGAVDYAIVTTVAESERGVRYPLVSRWYWDPTLNTWHCSEMDMKNVAAHVMWY